MKFEPFSEKQLATLCWWAPNSPYSSYDAIICDGAVRSGKSLCMFVSFVFWATSSFHKSSFAICGRTASSVRRNLLTPYLPVLKQLGLNYSFKLSEGKLTVKTNGRENTFFIFGGKDEASASLIQGMTLCLMRLHLCQDPLLSRHWHDARSMAQNSGLTVILPIQHIGFIPNG